MSEAPKPSGSFVAWVAGSGKRAFFTIFITAFAVRLAMLPYVPRKAIVPHTDWEVEAVAVSLATTGAFADPYALPTGPTAHVPPAYPALLALIYRLFELTMTAGYVAWVLRIAASAAVLALLPWAGRRLGVGAQAGVVVGLAGAVIPQWPHQAEPIASLAMALLMVAHVRRWTERRGTLWGSAILGIAWGAAFHVSPTLLAVFAGTLLFEIGWLRDRRATLRAGAIALGAVLACIPWGWRNYTTFGELFFVRSNFGLELRMGNHEGAVADIDVMDRLEGPRLRHPRTNAEEARRVRELGEVAYMRESRREAVAWIREHPGAFLRLTLQRAFHFWFGGPSLGWLAAGRAILTLLAIVGAWRTLPSLAVPARAALLIPLATYPIVYYVVVYMPRYGEPVGWILFLLAGAAIRSFVGGTRERNATLPS